MKLPELIELIYSGNFEGFREALEAGILDVDAVDELGRTSLMHAVIDKNKKIAECLLRKGANPNAQDKAGSSPLHFATSGFEIEMAKLLLANGAYIDLQDMHGNTPLSNAVFYSEGRGQLVELLLNAGANRDLRNNSGISPIALAKSIGNFNVVRFFTS